ncbi:hypothetical protein [Pseudoxanthomonas broegbernensis]|nr:hypothetical protein [Pseudoxanthomonas broegbernensis]MBB6064883.1 hypothetical protein [Pseudoxanthomonas broegbernensis]
MEASEASILKELHWEPVSGSERIERKLAALRQEYLSGQDQARALDARTRELQQVMLRIQGAIAVLEELLSQEQPLRG